MTLSIGTHDVPPATLATVVTWLEMTAPAAPRPVPAPKGVTLEHVPGIGAARYRAIFTHVGAREWLWTSRLELAGDALAAILSDPLVEVRLLRRAGRDEGLVELDFRVPGACELAFFGLSSALLGTGAGRWAMNAAVARAWSRPISRFHVHTCTLDHPAALDFYRRSGFRAVRQAVDVSADPRLDGTLPPDAAPRVPIIR